MSLPLSKYYDPITDLPELQHELRVVDKYFTSAAPQSEHRRWEYAMALRALDTWEAKKEAFKCYDIGGAGSPFRSMVGGDTEVVDPSLPNGFTLEQFTCPGTELASAVFCLSVLEHVDDLDQFLYHLSCLTAPGGLLFLTMDCCGCFGEKAYHTPEADPHHFNGLRKRIVTHQLLYEILDVFVNDGERVSGRQFSCLGGEPNYDNYTPQLYGGANDPGYSFASLALVKRS